MDRRSLLAQVIAEASRLGLMPWERLVLILVCAFLLVLGQRGIAAVKGLSFPPAPPPEPTNENDGGGPAIPDAEWADNTDPNAAPPG